MMFRSATTRKLLLISASATAFTMTMSGMAQAQVLKDEIIVTAQKKEQSLQDVGVSISAFTGEQIDALGWTSSLDISAQTPGLVTTSNSGDSGNLALFSIRGVSQLDFAEGQEAPIALYRDEAYISSPGASGAPSYDLKRIEVLRGPQGTLYGRNATGGLVHFISNRPTEEFEGSVGATVGEYGQIGLTGVLSGAISDNVQGRLALYYNKDDGYIENRNGDNFRSDNTFSGRGMLNFDIGSDSTLLLIGQHTTIDTRGGVYNSVASSAESDPAVRTYCTSANTAAQQTCRDASFGLFGHQNVIDDNNSANFVSFDGIDDGDGDIYAGAFDFDGGVDRASTNLTAIFKTSLSDTINLTSVSDYTTSDKDYREDDDSTLSAYATYEAGAKIDQLSQEVRLDGGNETFNWIVGGYYLNIDNDFYGAFKFPTFGRGFVPRFEATNKTTTISMFGQSDYALSDTLTLTTGLRWMQDSKSLTTQFVEDSFPGSGFLNDGGKHKIKRKDSKLSGKIQLDWQASDDHLLYAGISRGVKGGGFNTDTYGAQAPTLDAIGFDPEILTAYEAGFKSQFGDLRLNGSLFYYDYDNYQAFFFEGTTSLFINSTAKFHGGELEATYSPGGGWDFLAGISIMDTNVNNVAEGVIDQNAPLAPDLSLNGLARKSFDFSNGASLAVQVSANYVGEQSFNVIQSQITTGGDYALANASVTYYAKDDRWEAGLFVNNLTNEEPLTYTYDILGYTIQTYGPPRWAGAKVKFNF